MLIAGKDISPLRALQHVTFWVIWVVSFTVIQSLGRGHSEIIPWLMYYIITLPVFAVHTYLIAYWLVPKYFKKRRFLLFAGWILVLLFVFSIIELIVSNYLVFAIFSPAKVFGPGYLNPLNIIASGLGNHYIIFVFIAIKAARSWNETRLIKDELEMQNLETELEINRYQLRPEFILSLVKELEVVAETNAGKVPALIVKISEFINSLLFEAKAVLIPLETEIKLIADFFAIQETVIGKRLKTNLIANGLSAGKVVPPLLIFPFLDEACKIVNKCNRTFECTVIIKVEAKYILISFSLWSEYEFIVDGDINMELIKKRLYYNYENKYRIIENEDANFKEVSIEIFK